MLIPDYVPELGSPEYKEWERLGIKINNELAIPSFQKFCKDHNLNFHSPGQIPDKKISFEILDKEFPLHWEAVDLFNKMKNRYDYFNKEIVEYELGNPMFGFDFRSYPVDLFLEKTEEETKKILRELEQRKEQYGFVFCAFFVVLLFVVALFLTTLCVLRSPIFINSFSGDNWAVSCLAVAIVFVLALIPSAVFVFILAYILETIASMRTKRKLQAKEKAEIGAAISKLRQKLASVYWESHRQRI